MLVLHTCVRMFCSLDGILSWEWVWTCGIYFYTRLFCIIILFFSWLVSFWQLCRILVYFFKHYLHCFFPFTNAFSIGLIWQTVMVWLWGVNLWVFAQSTVNYAKIFDLDQNHLTHREIWKVKFQLKYVANRASINSLITLYLSLSLSRIW